MLHLIKKIQEKGLNYAFRRLLWKVVRFVVDRTKKVTLKLWCVFESMTRRNAAVDNVLYAFCDLNAMPATYDFVKFMALASSYCVERNYASLSVVIVPGCNEGFRKEFVATCDIEEKKWRLRNIIIPSCWLFPLCKGVIICNSRKEAKAIRQHIAGDVFPEHFTTAICQTKYSYNDLLKRYSGGFTIPSIKATEPAKAYVNQWIQNHAGNRKIVAITLRECEYEQARNSNITAWTKMATYLDARGYCPVIIHDAYTAMNRSPPTLSKFPTFNEAVWNIELRAAMYELCYLNLLTNNGPITLCWLNSKSRYIVFKMYTDGGGAASKEYLQSVGLNLGDQYMMANACQKLVWKPDDFGVIREEFEKMCQVIEKRK